MAEETAQALWYVAARPGRNPPRNRSPRPTAGEVRVRALHGALSRGTERLVFSGRVPASEYERMRAPHMGGTFPFPVKYGYATVGRVEQGRPSWRGPHRVRAPPASNRIHAARRRRDPDSGRRAAGARRARRQYGDGAQRGVGRGAGPGRPHRGGRRRGGGCAGRLAVRPAARRPGDAGRYRAGAGAPRRDARRRLRGARRRRRAIATSSSMRAGLPPGSRPRSASPATRRPCWS